MTDTVETIKVNFIADAKGLKTAIDQVDKELGKLVVRTDQAQRVLGNGLGKASTQATAGLKKTTAAMKTSTKATQTATVAINQYSAAQNRSMKMSGRMRADIQNFGYQIADVAVMAEMGTSAFRIMGQQGSQILGIFGPAGAIAGGFVAIAAAAIPMFTSLGQGTKDLTEETDKLKESLENMTAALERAVSVKAGDGVLSQIISGISILAISDAERALKSMAEAASSVLSSSGDAGWFDFQDMEARMAEIQEVQATMQQNLNEGWATNTKELQDRLTLMMKLFYDEFDTTYDAAVRFQTALESIGNIDLSEGPADLVASLSRIESQLRPVKDSSDETYELWRNIVIALEGARAELDAQTEALQQYNIELYTTHSTYGEMARQGAKDTKALAAERALAKRLLEEEARIRKALVGDQAQEAANEREHAEYLIRQRKLHEDLVDLIREEWINYRPLTQAQRDMAEATQEVVDAYVKGQQSAKALKERIGEAAFEAMRLAGVDMFSPISAAQIEAAKLAASMGLAYEYGQQLALYRATNGSIEGARTVSRGLVDNSHLGVPGGSLPDSLDPEKNKDKPGGGSGKSAAEKAQEDLEKSIRKTMKAMDEQIELTQQWSDQWEESLGNGVGSALDGFVDGLASGELAFKDFAKSVVQDLSKIILKAMLAQLILSALGISPGMAAADASMVQRIVGGGLGFDFAAKGMALNNGSPVPFANGGVVNAPTMFPMTGGKTGLMGEAGPEAIMPLSRDASGKLGVEGAAPKIVVNNYSGQEVVVNQNQQIIEIAVGQARKAVANDFTQSMASGQGTYARSMESSYNSRRKAT